MYHGFYMLDDMLLIHMPGRGEYISFDKQRKKLDMMQRDSLLFSRLIHHEVVSPELNHEGLFLFKLHKDDAFLLLHRKSKDQILAYFTSESWDISTVEFDFRIVYDIYFMVIFSCAVIIVYFFGLMVLAKLRAGKGFDENQLPQVGIASEDYKLRLTYTTMRSLRDRSETMLRLGIIFGIFGVLVSALVFKTSNLQLSSNWTDPHTLIGVLKPIIILLFIETFTFYFLKQYRIIFNEYKLYYSMFVDMLGLKSLVDLNSLPGLDDRTRQLLQEKISKQSYDLYEKQTRTPLNEVPEATTPGQVARDVINGKGTTR